MTTLQKTNAELPQDVADELRKTRGRSPAEFQAYVIALRKKNWPFRAIGDAFGVTRVAAKSWHTRALDNPEAITLAEMISVPGLPVKARGSGTRAKKIQVDVPPNDRETIRELAEASRSIRRWTPVDSPARAAALELEAMIYKYADQRGVQVSRLAEYAGVSRRAVAQRLEKHRARLVAAVTE